MRDTMAEIDQYTFTHREIVEALMDQAGIREGKWKLGVEFSYAAFNAGPDESSLMPAAVVGVRKVALTRTDEDNNLVVDAASRRPKGKARRKSAGGAKSEA